jgi:hypothetical protein
VSLFPRRLRDHTNWMVEWALVASWVGAFVWLARYYMTPSHHVGLRGVFGLPVLMVYMQFALLLIKYVVVASPYPYQPSACHRRSNPGAMAVAHRVTHRQSG